MADPRLDDVIGKVQEFATNAAQDERQEPGPGDVAPTTDTKNQNPLIAATMPPEEVKAWWTRIKNARKRRDERAMTWDVLLEEYLPTVSKSGVPENVKTNAHFRNVHSKLGQLFYRSPDLILSPKEPSALQTTMPNPADPQGAPMKMEDIVIIKQAVLQQWMGRDGIKGHRLMDEMLFDVLAWAGIGCCKVGYQCVTAPIQKPRMQPDPTWEPTLQPGAILGIGMDQQPPMVPVLGPDQQPVVDTVNVPIHEIYYARRFSPKKSLFDGDLKSTRVDEDATWTGMEFYFSKKRMIKAFKLTEEQLGSGTEDKQKAEYKEDAGTQTGDLVHGVELWVKASYFVDGVVHPEAIWQLVLIEGKEDAPVVWRPSPDQTFGEDGKLTKDSVTGFPIKFLTIRDLADSPFPPADSAFTNSLVKELNTWRRQSVQLRDRAIGKILYDLGAIGPEDKDKIQNGAVGDMIGMEAGKLAQGLDKIMGLTPQPHQTTDDARNQNIIKEDMNETLAISPPQAGAMNSTIHTATEVSAVSAGANERNDKERERTVDCYLDIARMVDQFLMRYATRDQYVEIVGAQGAKTMAVWNNQIIGGVYLYDIAPDSQLKADNARDYQLLLNTYNQTAKDPLTNRDYLLRRLFRMRGLDPNRAVLIPKPQAPRPPQPSVSIALKGDDISWAANTLAIDPNNAGAKVIIGLAEQAQLAPPAPQQLPHGGTAEAVNQHHASNSGGRPNEPGADNHRAAQPGPM